MSKRTTVEATAIVVGTIIGAGVLGIPFVVARSGFVTGMVALVVLTAVVATMHLMLAEVAARTTGTHQLTGYAERYMGKGGKIVMMFGMILSLYGALTAYLIGISQTATEFVGFGRELWWGVAFFGVAGAAVFVGLSLVKRFEMALTFLILVVVLALAVVSGPHIDPAALTHYASSKLFLPYGVILFALLGTVAIPEAARVLHRDPKELKRAVFWGTVIPAIIYALFAFTVVGVTGGDTTEIATIGLGERLGQTATIFGSLFALFAMGTSFLTISLALLDMYHYDYKLTHVTSWLLTLAPPLIAFLLSLTSFAETLGVVGGIAGSVEGLLVIALFMKARKQGDRTPAFTVSVPNAWLACVGAVFLGGLVWTIWKILNLGVY
ncbi:MAG: aromatic amino acid transport family protein [bacterium]|nr:aromatic amino acid transport family protein [bacterium]